MWPKRSASPTLQATVTGAGVPVWQVIGVDSEAGGGLDVGAVVPQHAAGVATRENLHWAGLGRRFHQGYPAGHHVPWPAIRHCRAHMLVCTLPEVSRVLPSNATQQLVNTAR
jgi:hypothetical protein